MKKLIFKIVGILLVVAIVLYVVFSYAAKFGADKAVQAMRAQATTPYVYVGKATTQNQNTQTRFIALVKPLNAVDVKTQVAGVIQEVAFTDGQYVHEGDTLFVIEQDRYQANVSSAKATLAKAEADLKQVKSDYDRQKQLYKEKVVSTSDLEKSESRMAQAEAVVAQAKAALDLAEIDLKHATITAPIDGHIGQVLITKGNYVDLSTPALVRIVQTKPVKIAFALSDKENLAMRKVLKGKEAPADRLNLQIELSDKSVLPLPADHLFLDNELDPNTATLSLYAEYDNKEGLLVPNNHVTVLWTSNEKKPVLLLPQTAIYNDANGSYVMLVHPDNTVVQQYVKTGPVVENNIQIESGLTTEDTIVLSGGQKLHNGQSIHVIETEKK